MYSFLVNTCPCPSL